LVPRSNGTPVAMWAWPTWVVSRRRVSKAVFILLEFPSPSRRIFIGSHSLPPSLVRRIGLSEVTVALLMTWHAAGTVDPAGIEPKQMLMGLARMSAMLSGKMTSSVEAIELHEEHWIPPLPSAPTVRCLDLDSPQGG
jgi:hypothetical protein